MPTCAGMTNYDTVSPRGTVRVGGVPEKMEFM